MVTDTVFFLCERGKKFPKNKTQTSIVRNRIVSASSKTHKKKHTEKKKTEQKIPSYFIYFRKICTDNKMHIHPSSPNSSPSSEDDAAARIQAGFRGYRVRKQLKQAKKLKENKNQNGHANTSTSQVGQQRGSVRQIEEVSATKIQAGIRGFLVRKRQKLEKDAAVKIQANFRGFKTRKDLHDKRSL